MASNPCSVDHLGGGLAAPYEHDYLAPHEHDYLAPYEPDYLDVENLVARIETLEVALETIANDEHAASCRGDAPYACDCHRAAARAALGRDDG